MIYFYLALLAAIFGLLGFLLHAFCFSTPEDVESRQKIELLRKELETRQGELGEARDQVAKKSAIVSSLEQQVREKNEGMKSLQKMAARQDRDIVSLQKEAATIRSAVAARKPPDVPSGPQEIPPVVRAEPPVRAAAVPAPQPKAAKAPVPEIMPPPLPQPSAPPEVLESPSGKGQSAAPVWRENLNNIIDILDAMEKEVEK